MGALNREFNNIYLMNMHEINRRFLYMGEGISRIVYAINDKYVIKVAKGDEGLFQNRVENYVFKHSGRRLRSYLCPIIWSKPRMIVMPRALPMSKLSKNKHVDLHSIRTEPTAYNDLVYLSKKFYLFFQDIESASSWGLINNLPVLIDYGCTSEEGDSFYE
jgi:hypothetical protein